MIPVGSVEDYGYAKDGYAGDTEAPLAGVDAGESEFITGDRISSTEFKDGVGFQCLLGGAVMALISGLLGVLDRCVCIDEKRSERLEEMGIMGCTDDGVGYTGRFGALLSACSWIIMLAALATHSWVETDKFGSPGCFCTNSDITNRSNGCMGRATIGLWQ